MLYNREEAVGSGDGLLFCCQYLLLPVIKKCFTILRELW